QRTFGRNQVPANAEAPTLALPRTRGRDCEPRSAKTRLLDLGASARVLELLQDALGLFAVDALHDRLRRLVDQVLGFLEAQPRDLANDLDHTDLGVARRGQ